jgi:hypothetical protein
MHVIAETTPEVRPAALTIEAIEVTPIVVPLAQEYRRRPPPTTTGFGRELRDFIEHHRVDS